MSSGALGAAGREPPGKTPMCPKPRGERLTALEFRVFSDRKFSDETLKLTTDDGIDDECILE